MELFSELYSCYYQVLRHLLLNQNAITMQDIRAQIIEEGFEESMLSIIPKLESGTWNLFTKDGELYLSKLSPSFLEPLSDLEKSYLKALLSDSRIGLFLTQEQLEALNDMLASVTPLWKPEQLYYYDRFADGDPYDDETYRSHFQVLLHAQKKRQYVDIDYNAPSGKHVHHYYVPARLEYSVKNDKFRLLAFKHTGGQAMRLELLNIARIQNVRTTEKTLASAVDLNALIQNSYYKEPLRLQIVNERNALERAMLHFANYEKNTVKIDENTYECLIYYNQNMETELLIEVLSFGPMLTVLGNEKFLDLLKARLERQTQICI
ncbi:MAG: WYL domain-containing protein [Lachnospiraceae bacterium]|nr:WYL domain-containing protein [Lachnospiraceae bacterium]